MMWDVVQHRLHDEAFPDRMRARLQEASDLEIQIHQGLGRIRNILYVAQMELSPDNPDMAQLRHYILKLVQLTDEHRQHQAKWQQRHRQRLHTQLKLEMPAGTTDEQVDMEIQRMEQGDVRWLYGQVQHRAVSVFKMSQSIEVLQELMMEMALLATNADDAIQSISGNIQGTTLPLQQGTADLQRAIVSAQSLRRKRWILIGLVTTLLLVAVGIIIWLAIEASKTK
jgi:syntaxin 1B/2/3